MKRPAPQAQLSEAAGGECVGGRWKGSCRGRVKSLRMRGLSGKEETVNCPPDPKRGGRGLGGGGWERREGGEGEREGEGECR